MRGSSIFSFRGWRLLGFLLCLLLVASTLSASQLDKKEARQYIRREYVGTIALTEIKMPLTLAGRLLVLALPSDVIPQKETDLVQLIHLVDHNFAMLKQVVDIDYDKGLISLPNYVSLSYLLKLAYKTVDDAIRAQRKLLEEAKILAQKSQETPPVLTRSAGSTWSFLNRFGGMMASKANSAPRETSKSFVPIGLTRGVFMSGLLWGSSKPDEESNARIVVEEVSKKVEEPVSLFQPFRYTLMARKLLLTYFTIFRDSFSHNHYCQHSSEIVLNSAMHSFFKKYFGDQKLREQLKTLKLKESLLANLYCELVSQPSNSKGQSAMSLSISLGSEAIPKIADSGVDAPSTRLDDIMAELRVETEDDIYLRALLSLAEDMISSQEHHDLLSTLPSVSEQVLSMHEKMHSNMKEFQATVQRIMERKLRVLPQAEIRVLVEKFANRLSEGTEKSAFLEKIRLPVILPRNEAQVSNVETSSVSVDSSEVSNEESSRLKSADNEFDRLVQGFRSKRSGAEHADGTSKTVGVTSLDDDESVSEDVDSVGEAQIAGGLDIAFLSSHFVLDLSASRLSFWIANHLFAFVHKLPIVNDFVARSIMSYLSHLRTDSMKLLAVEATEHVKEVLRSAVEASNIPLPKAIETLLSPKEPPANNLCTKLFSLLSAFKGKLLAVLHWIASKFSSVLHLGFQFFKLFDLFLNPMKSLWAFIFQIFKTIISKFHLKLPSARKK